MSRRQLENKLLEVIGRLGGARVGIVGDLVADCYVSGLSDRVSREAPVLIVQYEQEWLRPGGAANVAANVAALGATACVVGIVGDDEPGRGLLAVLEGAGGPGRVRCEQVLVDAKRATITKTRFLVGARHTSRQQVLRLDRQPAGPPNGPTARAIAERIARLDAEVDAWIASDYGYGGFDEALRGQLREIAARKPVVADSRYAIHLFRGMTVIKPNEDEARTAAHVLQVSAGDEAALAVALAGRLEARAAVITLGNKGMVLGMAAGAVRIPAAGTEEIVDLTGAGDSVAATLTAALAAGADIETACRLANAAGSVVVMKEGAATCSPEELREAVRAPAAP